MLNFLIDNIFVVFGGTVFQQTIGIPIIYWKICSCILMKPNSFRSYCLTNKILQQRPLISHLGIQIMSFPPIIIHFMITYTLYTHQNWISKRPPTLLQPLEKFYFRKLYCRFNDLLQHIIRILPFRNFCVSQSSVYMCYIHRISPRRV